MKSQITCAMALAISLLACAQETVGAPPTTALNAAAPAGQAAPARVLVQFKNPSAIDAQAFVQRLQSLTHTSVHYVAAVSGDTHVYRLQPPSGQNLAQLLQQLQSMPEIARVEFDQKAKAP